MENLFAVIFLIFVIGAIYYSMEQSKEKQKIIERENANQLLKNSVDFERTKILYTQFKDYLNNLFQVQSEYTKNQIAEILSNDFPLYKAIIHPSVGSLFNDLLCFGIIYETQDHKNNISKYTKGKCFKDIRLNFPNFLSFVSIDEFGMNFNDGGFRDKRYSEEARLVKSEANDAKNKKGIWTSKRFIFGIATGTKLNSKRIQFDNMINDDDIYLYCIFSISKFQSVESLEAFCEPIRNDMSYQEYNRIFQNTYKDIDSFI